MKMCKNFEIDCSKITIDKLFQNAYVVPDYQREYVWEETQVEQLLDDLITAYNDNEDKAYFMGMTVVCFDDCDSKYELIDGQQRITTFFIMLCAFVYFFKENNEKYSHIQKKLNNEDMDSNGMPINRFALELQYLTSKGVLENIYNNNVVESVIDELPDGSDKRLYKAYQKIKEFLSDAFTEVDGFNFESLRKFTVYIWKKVQLVQIETTAMSDALKIFETINQRGVGLNSLDLLKNMIFMQVDRQHFKKLNESWKEMIDELLKVEKKPLRFLRYFITANYDISDNNTGVIKGILPEDDIYEWFAKNDAQCDYSNHPFEFINTLTDNVKKYVEYLNPDYSLVGNEYLRNIPKIAGSSYKSHLVLLLAANNMEDNVMIKFKELLEILIYYATINGIKGNETEKLFATWAPQIKNIKSKEHFVNFVNKTIEPQIDKWCTEKNYKQRFLELNSNSIQKYRIKYVLARIGKYVDEYRSNGTKFANIEDYFAKNIEIEHIMPRECNNYSKYGIKNKEDFNLFISKLGNLTILEKTYNASCKNKLFIEKKDYYLESHFYLSSSIFSLSSPGVCNAANRMDKKLKKWEVWNKDSIIERQEILFNLAKEVWNVEKLCKW